MKEILNFYKFTHIPDPQALQERWRHTCHDLGCMGTIIIAPEGINAMVAGSSSQMASIKQMVAAELGELSFKVSYSPTQPFRRMLVKVKPEIVTLRQNVDPQAGAQYLSPQNLRSWLDEGKEVCLIDVRNDYEYSLGSFKGALNPQTNSFTEFSKWVDQNNQDLNNKTVVTFCTGGIRCEKATAYMRQKGIEQIFQLEGGIISYLENNPDDPHWQGECVVFDKRKAVDKQLKPSERDICYVCLREADLLDQEFPGGRACQNCTTKMRLHLQKRQARGHIKQAQHYQERHNYLKSQRAKYQNQSNAQTLAPKPNAPA